MFVYLWIRLARINLSKRIQAYAFLQGLKLKGSSRSVAIDLVKEQFGIPTSTCYLWFAGSESPWGALGRLKSRDNLYYVLGVLLGDGYAYEYHSSYQIGILVKEKSFAAKFAKHLSKCIGRNVVHYPSRKRNLWFVRAGNYPLFVLFNDFKSKIGLVKHRPVSRLDALQFIEGFFDAEGCMKLVKEKARRTPKICLDFTNTNYEILEAVQNLLRTFLNIEDRFSVQHDKRKNRRPVYHLRIYKKSYVSTFFKNIETIKLNEAKKLCLEKRLQLGLPVKP